MENPAASRNTKKNLALQAKTILSLRCLKKLPPLF